MAKAKPIKGLDCSATTGQMARHIASVRLQEVYKWERYIDQPFEVQGLHNLRIAAKRLRYTFEIFEDVLPEVCKAYAEELQQIQDELGVMHDSDVMIALLRLCLGSQDSGTAYEMALTRAGKQNAQQKFTLPSALVADVLNPAAVPDANERYGLEQLLIRQQEERVEQYRAFRRHWYELKGRDFRREMLQAVDAQ
jgi:CHAD domain-containing protein